MNFFKLYIGDYQKATGALSLTEHGAYLLMLQHFYATQEPLPKERRDLYRLLRADSLLERRAIDSVLERFWVATDLGWINARAEKEIAKADEISETNRRTAVEREARRRARIDHATTTPRATDVPRTSHERSTSHSHSQKELKETHTGASTLSLDARAPDPVSDQPRPEVQAAKAMIAAGCPPHRVNHHDPRLTAAIAEGCTDGELGDATAEAVAKGVKNPFAYAIETARGRHAEAAKPATGTTLATSTGPPARQHPPSKSALAYAASEARIRELERQAESDRTAALVPGGD